MSNLHPVHFSIRRGSWRIPSDMERIKLPPEHCEALTSVALSIFTDCVNVGVRFQDALLAIYLSGLQHGATVWRPLPEPPEDKL